jgi:hypothetical protein
MPDPLVIEHRVTPSATAAIVFVHGFGGDAKKTWGKFPDFLAADAALKRWDILSIGYPTTLLRPDISGLWSAQPPLQSVSGELRARTGHKPFDRYGALAFIAHSMGGLVVQHALLDPDDDGQLAARTAHLLMFGTPSFGLAKAGFFSYWKRQIRDMRVDGDFIRTLRTAWNARVAQGKPINVLAVAGDQDEFVPVPSSVGGIDPWKGFTGRNRAFSTGNHVQMVKPEAADHLSVLIATKFLAEGGNVNDAASVAAERTKFQADVDRLLPSMGKLDDRAVVELSLALERLGDAAKAIEVLQAQPQLGLDARGVLAGRLKRRWLLDRAKADAQAALKGYQDACDEAQRTGPPEQVYYQAINVAFMKLAYEEDLAGARRMAAIALAAIPSAPAHFWRDATEGEAAIIMGDDAGALAAYGRALAAQPKPRQVDSMFQQASFELDLLGNVALAREMQSLFEAPRGEADDTVNLRTRSHSA